MNIENYNTEKLIDEIVATYQGDSGINFIDVTNLPVRDKILEILNSLMEILFPGYTGKRMVTRDNVKFVVGDILHFVRGELSAQIELSLKHMCRINECEGCDCQTKAAEAADALLAKLPEIREMLKLDVQAAYDGDPAATSFEEIVLSYPSIGTVAIHRIAHELYLQKVPLIPRIMSEYAHSKTGIDIHPGAKIGKRFFIDHGTGVVIGETAIIGNNVKIYQGVTLGALSPAAGQILRDVKRHPTIEDDVTIYAEATILGDIIIGQGSTISGNSWLNKSVPAGTTVLMSKPKSLYRQKGGRQQEDQDEL